MARGSEPCHIQRRQKNRWKFCRQVSTLHHRSIIAQSERCARHVNSFPARMSNPIRVEIPLAGGLPQSVRLTRLVQRSSMVTPCNDAHANVGILLHSRTLHTRAAPLSSHIQSTRSAPQNLLPRPSASSALGNPSSRSATTPMYCFFSLGRLTTDCMTPAGDCEEGDEAGESGEVVGWGKGRVDE